jgi:hypothetical protein
MPGQTTTNRRAGKRNSNAVLFGTSQPACRHFELRHRLRFERGSGTARPATALPASPSAAARYPSKYPCSRTSGGTNWKMNRNASRPRRKGPSAHIVAISEALDFVVSASISALTRARRKYASKWVLAVSLFLPRAVHLLVDVSMATFGGSLARGL